MTRSENLGITIAPREKRALRRAAAEHDMTMSSFLRLLILSNQDVKRHLFFAESDQSIDHNDEHIERQGTAPPVAEEPA